MQRCTRGQQLFRTRRPQSVRGSVWYAGGRKKKRQKQTGGFFPLAAVAGPLLGDLGGVVMRKIFGARRKRKHVKYVLGQNNGNT